MIEGIYYYGNHLRWNLGWPNPNVAGAFLIGFFPILWTLGRIFVLKSKGFWWALMLLTGELTLWFFLAKTYSRGALVAVALSAIFFSAMLYCKGLSKEIQQCLWAIRGLRFGGIFIILFATSFIGRIEPGFVSEDASVGNRVTLWQGGLQMIAAEPFEGWGRGNSGDGFMQWYQAVDADERYAGMVNSYLHFGVERGLIQLGIVLLIALAFALMAILGARRALVAERLHAAFILAACGAIMAGFMGVNFFSTLWIVPGLWYVPSIAALGCAMVVVYVFKKKSLPIFLNSIGVSAVASLLGLSALYYFGSSLEPDTPVLKHGDGVIASNFHDAQNGMFNTIQAYPDTEVLGDQYGKELRRLLLELRPTPWRIATGDDSAENSPDVYLLFGRCVELPAILEKSADASIIVVHPTEMPVEDLPKDAKISVILPGLNFFGAGASWKRMAKANNWPVVVAPGVATDIRPVWPQIILPLLSTDQQR